MFLYTYHYFQKQTKNGRLEQQKLSAKSTSKSKLGGHTIQGSIYEMRKWKHYNKGFNIFLVSSNRSNKSAINELIILHPVISEKYK